MKILPFAISQYVNNLKDLSLAESSYHIDQTKLPIYPNSSIYPSWWIGSTIVRLNGLKLMNQYLHDKSCIVLRIAVYSLMVRGTITEYITPFTLHAVSVEIKRTDFHVYICICIYICSVSTTRICRLQVSFITLWSDYMAVLVRMYVHI